ncbi:MAG: N-acetyltransferase [Actinobacteria bacterium]|nr:N-acetyltransferase [Actinomycetota bacterium]MBU4217961.1 N-acetyltransferase [Actinomycetota bacterium]MBU4357925.1 N-acetyltransferase [Actinomycetota bacterium]MBU4393024.1 N-acetyltransferase [Actinomycetota bacterium]
MCLFVAEDVQIPEDVRLGKNVVIEDSVTIGSGCDIGHGVIIYSGTAIGANVSIGANSIIGRQPKSGVSSTRKTGKEPPLTISDNVVIGSGAVIYAGTTVEKDAMIGDLAAIREHCKICEAAIIGRSVTMECNSIIGPRSKIQTACHITGDLVVEEDVFFGPEVVTMNDKYMETRDFGLKGPHVKKKAAIGSNSTILAGVTIGEGAIVGAGSVVTKDVPKGMTYCGTPARPLEKRKQ